MPVLRSTYQELRDRYRKVVEERDDAVKLAAERLSTITRQANEISRLRDEQPDRIVAAPPPARGDAEVRRQLFLTQRALADMQQRLDDLQTSHIADTRELHDLRQGATS
ncbi:hypothetical protein EDD90_3253 [Streptomyces sp. Ag109_O5-1]|uniref:hypothetical protein n=1 Tax=Streptomyces sp. Ag109_O5-1 TaxID=1938851 RepID=UPI000F5114B7|nr:hypothetical protein [Streptomyces sp. Ag109_O5-1]RPE40217.1 hypothetical protein EDD90_3253 [Streptomyces sp. Ag109_O5-1]